MTVPNSVLMLQLIAALLALIGLAFVAKQSKVQANSQEFASLIVTDERWVTATKSEGVPLSANTLEVIRKIYRLPGISAASCLPPNIELNAVTREVPYIMEFLLPSWERNRPIEDVPAGTHSRERTITEREGFVPDPPVTEKQYLEFALGHRVSSALIVLDILEQIRVGEPAAIEALDLDIDAVTSVRVNFTDLCKTMTGFVNGLNNIAEFFDLGLINRKAFLGKRHVSIIRIATATEPYVLWKCVNDRSRWGLRVLSLGSAARAYHRLSKIQQGLIAFAFDPQEYRGLGTTIGPLFSATESQKMASRFGVALNTFIVRAAIGKCFGSTAKGRQNNVCRELRKALREDSKAATPKVLQILKQLNTHPDFETISSGSSLSTLQQEIASALSHLRG